MQCKTKKSEWDQFQEITDLIQHSQIQPRFENYKADFKAEKRAFEFAGSEGIYVDSIMVITDHDKYVSLYFQTEKPYLDVFASNPYAAPTHLEMPVRHHNATLLGTRLTTSVWYDKWGISGDIHDVNISDGGETLTIVESQKWRPDGQYGREGESVYEIEFNVHPYFGYAVTFQCSLVTNDSLTNHVEFMNFMPPDVVNPWPGQNQFPFTIYASTTPKAYHGYANNLYAGNLSDENKTDWGKGIEIRNGGFIAMLEADKPSPALFRKGDLRFVQRTCDAWLDQHNHILLPSRDSDGFFRMNPEFLFVYLPSEISNYLLDKVIIEDFENKEATMIRLGTLEDFENQPIELTEPVIGLTRGFWEKDFVIDTTESYSGKKSLRIDGKSAEELRKTQENFIRYPQVPLQENSCYRLSARVKTNSLHTNAWISASTYEWTPYDTSRLSYQYTNISSDTSWRKIELEFYTPDFDPFVDVRFMVENDGNAWFDDFEFKKLADQNTVN
jgi:hypothetical protein